MNIVDLFSGAGGLTFGFYFNLENGQFIKNENNKIIFANELNTQAAKAFSLNFPDINMIVDDISNLTAQKLLTFINEEVDLIIGGPPCQSYSTIGKRRWDDKAQLYNQYLRVLNIIRPRMFVFENVKGILSMKTNENSLVIDDIKQRFGHIEDNFGYYLNISTLDAASFGVPQHRERVFIVGVRKDLNLKWQFPIPTNGDNLIPYVTIFEAISDLPKLLDGQQIEQYTNPPATFYQVLMRNGCNKLTQHYCGLHNYKIQQVIANVPQGEGRFYINDLVNRGILPEDCRLTSGYKNTYGRLVQNRPCTTITNNMCTPSALRCIHYEQNRALTPREGARIQSFPDWFQFCGEKVDVTKQIGNAVPPLLAIKIARQIEKTIEEQE